MNMAPDFLPATRKETLPWFTTDNPQTTPP